MKYKVGDKVRVRKDLELGNKYGKVLYISSMDEFKDKECVITNIDDLAYQLNNSGCWWSEEMFELIDERILLEYALEKLGMTKEELEDEMNEDKKDMVFVEKYIKDKKERREYCNRFNSDCEGCEIKKFRNKYKDKYYGDIDCAAVFRYLKEKGEI